jgi:hypothetical protein
MYFGFSILFSMTEKKNKERQKQLGMERHRLVEKIPSVKMHPLQLTKTVKETKVFQERVLPCHHCLNLLCT